MCLFILQKMVLTRHSHVKSNGTKSHFDYIIPRSRLHWFGPGSDRLLMHAVGEWKVAHLSKLARSLLSWIELTDIVEALDKGAEGSEHV
jgi:hypothetical protein